MPSLLLWRTQAVVAGLWQLLRHRELRFGRNFSWAGAEPSATSAPDGSSGSGASDFFFDQKLASPGQDARRV